jgi:hypothetical protein
MQITREVAVMRDADYLLEKAEQCFRLAAFSRGHVLSPEIAKAIDALGDELMNKAVEIDTERQRFEVTCVRIRDPEWYLVIGERWNKVSISAALSTRDRLQK